MVLRDCFAWSPMGCGPCKPQYKRLVDGIYPHNPYEGGLVKTNMEKLLFFALSSPEKIDKIGKYLAKRLEADIYRGRIGWVRTSMQALDQLLVSCQAPDQSRNLNLFVESFLTMLQRLLERDEPDLQIIACHSFIKFANIEEDTPSYKRSYDFFISRFSSMCYYRSKDLELQKNMRMAGMHGLQGVVRKTVSDDLQVNIWEEQHMNKIIPALIYNMKERYDLDVRLRDQRNNSNNNNSLAPEESREVEFTTEIAQFAQDCLRDICSRCGYTNVLAVIKPTLEHHDLHKLWVPGDFAKMCISTICYAFPRQYAYKAVQILVAHLDQHAEDDAAVRISIIHVLEETVEIASTVGPSVFEVFDALLRHLKRSASRVQSSATERHFQSALVNAIGEFAASLPDYQKIEVMQLILDKARDPTVWSKRPGDNRKANASGISLNENYDMQCMLLRSLLNVSDKYVAQQMSTSFPSSLLDLLLPISVSESTQVRLLVQDIFQSLVDRHYNKKNVGKARTFDNPLDQLAQPPVTGSAETPASNAVGSATESVLIPETQVTSDDVRFSRMHLPRILSRMCQYITLSSNNNSCYQALFTTLTLIVLELAGSNNDAITEIVRYCYALEQSFSQPNEMPPTTANAELGELTDENVVDGVMSTPKITASAQLKSGLFSTNYAQQQSLAEISNATTVQKCAALSLVASVISLLVQVTAPRLDKLRGHVLGILEQRRLEGFWYLLPDRLFSNDQALQTADTIGSEFERLCQTKSLPVFFSEGALQLLVDVNVDVERIRKPFVVEKVIESPVSAGGINVADRAGVDVSLVNVSLDLGSDTDSVSIAETTNQRKRMGPHFDSIKFENLRKVLDEPIENLRAEKHRRQREIWRNFKEAPVEELIRMVEMRRGRYAHAMEDFFRTPSQSSRQSTASDSRSRSSSSAGSSSSEVTVAGTPPESVRKHRVRGAPPPLRHFEPPDILMY